MLLFCYGSNHPEQLSQRLGRPVRGEPAYLAGWGRTFRGHSARWGGAVANVEPDLARTVYGYVTPVREADLATLDLAEGVSLGLYRREYLAVDVRDARGRDTPREAVAYVRAARPARDPRGAPSMAYLEAVARTVGEFWRNADGSAVTPADLVVPVASPEPRAARNARSGLGGFRAGDAR